MTHTYGANGNGRGAVHRRSTREIGRVENADHQRRLYAMTTDLLGVAALDGRFLELSPSWERTLGYTHDELLASPYVSFVHPEDREQTVAEARRLAEEGEGSAIFVNRYRCKDGGYLWLEWTSVVDREAGFIYFVARDVSERVRTERALKDSEERLRALMESVPGYVITTDLEGCVIATNRPLTAKDTNGGIGISIFSLASPEHEYLVRNAFEHVKRTGENVRYEAKATLERGGEAWFTSEVGPLRRDDEIVGATFIANDVSDRVRLEREVLRSLEQVRTYSTELEEKNDALEREVIERREAERALAVKEDALRELGTPILEVWEGVLLLPVIGAVDRARAARMMDRLLPAIVETGAAVTIVDLTGVGAVDAATASHLFEIVRAVGLLGSRCVVSGISPSIARTMIALGVVDQRLTTFGTLASALGYALQGCSRRPASGRSGLSAPR
ncbi:PAS domain S-box protein [Polyangium aurulentum]|uniref:PAS domain S-box protein n=1 Tax=Polyangium aurulentum TaxID=2567896 RepID=UPI0010AE67FE|nr:PAS domain S-box protein [Polyangium aurulentum]UQA54840.1 PAS domain S-box protein [Polyangium aurulentum]